MPHLKKPLLTVIPHPRVRGDKAELPNVVARWHETSLGPLLIADDGGGICFIGLEVEGTRTRAEGQLHAHFPAATFARQSTPLMKAAAQTLAALYTDGRISTSPLPLSLYGTAFQIRVWRALLKIPFGSLVTYGDVARKIGAPQAARAVGGSVGSNPVSVLVPCHRVIGANGKDGLYGWGRDAKMNLIQKEAQA